MVTHSSILAWEIPWTEEPDGLQSTGSQRDTIEHAPMHIIILNHKIPLITLNHRLIPYIHIHTCKFSVNY